MQKASGICALLTTAGGWSRTVYRRKRGLKAAAVLAVAVGLTGCGGAQQAATTAAPSTATVQAPAAPAASTTATPAPAPAAAPTDEVDSAASDDTAAATVEQDDTADDPSLVTREEFGADWPLTVDEATLACDGSGGVGAVTITTDDGTTYWVNGIAKQQAQENGWQDIREIWADDPSLGIPDAKKPMVLIDRALSLCT